MQLAHSCHARSDAYRRYLALLVGWILFAGLCYIISQAPASSLSIYDPFEILGIPASSDEAFIKKHFKRISLKFHPDKIKLSPNQTKEDADAHFVDLTKAYKALTDDVIRENLQKYGNPDGVQSREETIAIPKWIVEGYNGIWVLAAYGLGLGGVLPWLVVRPTLPVPRRSLTSPFSPRADGGSPNAASPKTAHSVVPPKSSSTT